MSFLLKKIEAIVKDEKLSFTERRDQLAEFNATAADAFSRTYSAKIHEEADQARRDRDAEQSKLDRAKTAEARKSEQVRFANVEALRAQARQTGNPGLAMAANLAEQIAGPPMFTTDSEPPDAA